MIVFHRRPDRFALVSLSEIELTMMILEAEGSVVMKSVFWGNSSSRTFRVLSATADNNVPNILKSLHLVELLQQAVEPKVV